jgi:glyoxylase-like metal-dependent hydrolase (beta-lactamase superfamily II)/8-oxo-dGTP pyrophosphatase MutT (NUDIX family)
VSSIAQAASVLLARTPESGEVLVVRRAEQLRFFGGFWAFPGGKVSPSDAELPGVPPLVVTAVRELFEETGVLLARHDHGVYPAGSPQLIEARKAILENRASFVALLNDLKLSLHPEDFLPIGEITTPEFAPVRFATTFFVAVLPPGQAAEIWPGELDEALWATPAVVLERWRRGEMLLSPPTAMTLQAIEGRHAHEAPARLGPFLQRLAGGAMHPIYFAPAVQMIPLRAATLPPTTHTNAYLVGTGPRYLIDPGCSDAGEQRRLFDVLDEHTAEGRPLSAVVLTHHHPDHFGAATAVGQRYRVPILAHEQTAARLQGRVAVDRLIADTERLDLGPRPDGGGEWHLQALLTPGHCSGHLSFYDPFYRLLFAGDIVSTMTSVLIAPPDGDLTEYLQSLRRLAELPIRLLLPAHGNPSARPRKTLQDALDHRADRERQLVEALAAGLRTVEELGPALYRGLPPHLMKYAHMQIEAGLEKLRLEGRI